MSAIAGSQRPITLDDLRHKAQRIKLEVTDEARAQLTERRTQLLLAGVVAAAVVVSVAYLMGSRGLPVRGPVMRDAA